MGFDMPQSAAISRKLKTFGAQEVPELQRKLDKATSR
jgi:hypothetical protein